MQIRSKGKALAVVCSILLGSGFAIQTFAASTTSTIDAAKQKLFLPANFKVEIDGVIVGGFKEVSGHRSRDGSG